MGEKLLNKELSLKTSFQAEKIDQENEREIISGHFVVAYMLKQYGRKLKNNGHNIMEGHLRKNIFPANQSMI